MEIEKIKINQKEESKIIIKLLKNLIYKLLIVKRFGIKRFGIKRFGIKRFSIIIIIK